MIRLERVIEISHWDNIAIEETTILIYLLHTGAFQKEKQLVKYTGNLYLFSPYSVTKQTTIVLLPLRNVENYTKTKTVTQSDSTINYGTFGKKFVKKVHKCILKTNKFFTLTRLERVIEISHWGNVNIEETIDLLHTGALLRGLQ